MTEQEQVLSSLTELRKTVDTRLDDCIKRDELEKTVNAAIEKLHPLAERKAVLPEMTEEQVNHLAFNFKMSSRNTPEKAWTSEYGRKFGSMRNFIIAVRNKSTAIESAKATNTEGTPAYGGYTVPDEFLAEVIRLLADVSPIFNMCRVLPMNTWKRQIPTQLTAVTVGWVAELGTKSTTNPTFGQVEQVAKVMAAVIKCSDELLRDNGINLTAFFAELVAEAIALETERVALAGDVSGASDPFNGVLYTSGVNVVTMGGATLDGDDVIELVNSLSEANMANSTIALNRTALKQVMKLKGLDGQYLWQPNINGPVSATIAGVPYNLCSKIPTTLGTGSQTAMIYGNFKRALMLSPRTQIEVKASQDAADWVSSALDSAFMTDQTWFRFTQAMSIDVLQGSAFSYMLV